jgi:hypothetical protein
MTGRTERRKRETIGGVSGDGQEGMTEAARP